MSMFALESREYSQQILLLLAEPGCLVRWLTLTVKNSNVSLVTRQQEFKVQPNWNHPCYSTKHNVSYNWAAWTCWGRQAKWLLSLSSFPIRSFRFFTPQYSEIFNFQVTAERWNNPDTDHYSKMNCIFCGLLYFSFSLWLDYFCLIDF